VLRTFGCLCYPNTSATSAHKLSPCSLACVFIGHPVDHHVYKCYDTTHRVSTSQHASLWNMCSPSASQAPRRRQPRPLRRPVMTPTLLLLRPSCRRHRIFSTSALLPRHPRCHRGLHQTSPPHHFRHELLLVSQRHQLLLLCLIRHATIHCPLLPLHHLARTRLHHPPRHHPHRHRHSCQCIPTRSPICRQCHHYLPASPPHDLWHRKI
jgi:hypothetical protein